MAWRIAESLKLLRKQINDAYPNRDKSSDGGIGDAAHASRNSDHNPWVKDKHGVGVVTAVDIDEDLAPDIHSIEAIVTAIRKSRDPRVKYIIYEKRITVAGSDLQKWKPYHGKNPHDHHAHISVNSDPKLYDSTKPWALDLPKASAATPAATPETKAPADKAPAFDPQTPPETEQPPTDIVPPEQTQPAVTNTVVEQKTIESTPSGETITTTTAQSVAAPVEVVKESPSWMVKIAAPFTALAGLGINAGSFIQTKLEQMTPQQVGYMIAALGLVALAIYWWQKSAKAAQVRTMQLVEKAADKDATTVVLVNKVSPTPPTDAA